MSMSMPDHVKRAHAGAKCLYDLAALEKNLDRMALEITEILKDSNPIILGVMTGAMIPMGHLLVRLLFPLEIDYVHASRYRGAMRGGDLHWYVEPRLNLKDRTVLVFDDILDSGLTLSAIIDYCRQAGAKKIYSAVMVEKKCERDAASQIKKADFSCVPTGDDFLFGFGLDYDEYLRNVPGIYAVSKNNEKMAAPLL